MINRITLGICWSLRCGESEVDSHFSKQESQQLRVLIIHCELKRIPHHSADTFLLIALASLNVIDFQGETSYANYFIYVHGFQHSYHRLSLSALHNKH
jgi:hypothetical protein